MSRRVGILAPYFGPLPKSFQSWLVSAGFNAEVDFHLVTDQDASNLGCKNIFIHHMSFDDLGKLASDKLGVCSGFSPYKLCDFKPAYGVLFSDFIAEYDFWGHCDLDMVLGDLKGIISDLGLFNEFDKILDLGHLSLYRNLPTVNQAYASRFKGMNFWPYIRDSKVIWVFDEAYHYGMGGVNARIEQAGMKLFNDREIFSDIDPGFDGFFDIHNSPGLPSFFSFSGRSLTRHTLVHDVVVKDRCLYAHFQKRDFDVTYFSGDNGVIVPLHWGAVSSTAEAEQRLKSRGRDDFVVRPSYAEWKRKRSLQKKIQIIKELIGSPSSISFLRSIL